MTIVPTFGPGERPWIVDRLSELEWLTNVVRDSESVPREALADILHRHQDAQANSGGRICICGEWEGPWTGTGFENHQATMIIRELGSLL